MSDEKSDIEDQILDTAAFMHFKEKRPIKPSDYAIPPLIQEYFGCFLHALKIKHPAINAVNFKQTIDMCEQQYLFYHNAFKVIEKYSSYYLPEYESKIVKFKKSTKKSKVKPKAKTS